MPELNQNKFENIFAGRELGHGYLNGIKDNGKKDNCWNCALWKGGGITLLGACKWFEEPRDIPSEVIDRGCKFWRNKFTQKVIDKFDGELIIKRR